MPYYLIRKSTYPYQAPYLNATTVITEPAVTVPAKGGTYIDPQFGVPILRVTDAADGTSGGGTYYSYAPTLNSNNTIILAPDNNSTGGAIFLRFDPTGNLPALVDGVKITVPGSSSVRYDMARWAHNSANYLYAVGGPGNCKWYRADFANPSSPTQTMLADFTASLAAAIPGADYMWQMSLAEDDDTFAATVRNSSFQTIGWVVGKISNASILRTQTTTDIDEVQISRDGTYLIWKANTSANDDYFVNVATGATVFRQGTAQNPDASGVGHSDTFGTDWVIGAQGNWTSKIVKFRMSDPNTVTQVRGTNWTIGLNHFGMGADNQNWVLGEVSYEQTPRLALAQEIVQLSLDGTETFRRLFHHRSVSGDGYNYQPRANISRDGKFVAFSSNMGVSNGRVDLYIAKIPVAP